MNENQIKQICNSTVRFFEETKHDRGYRLMGLYPKNSCEVASGFLANALSEIFPSSKVEVIKATSNSKLRTHFWVEIDAWAIDTTIHQFPLFREAIACEAPSSAQKFFCEIERLSPAVSATNIEGLGISKPFIEEMSHELASTIRKALNAALI